MFGFLTLRIASSIKFDALRVKPKVFIAHPKRQIENKSKVMLSVGLRLYIPQITDN